MYQGECHCGAVSFTVTTAPQKLVDCNCSICRRLGALWGHVPVQAFELHTKDGSTIAYTHGERTLAIHTCNTCGCSTHWENLEPDGEYMGVNFRMCAPKVVQQFVIRRFDGADTWKFLD